MPYIPPMNKQIAYPQDAGKVLPKQTEPVGSTILQSAIHIRGLANDLRARALSIDRSLFGTLPASGNSAKESDPTQGHLALVLADASFALAEVYGLLSRIDHSVGGSE